MLSAKNISLKIDKEQILNKLNIELKPGEVHALMGPNGSGKTSLAQVLMGVPMFRDTECGKVSIDSKDVSDEDPNERAKKGLFLSFQNPVEIPGVRFSEFLRHAYLNIKDKGVEVDNFRDLLKKNAAELDLSSEFIDRELNAGLSGGEKKKMEMLQMLVLEPKYVIADEVDSGLDVDALKSVAKILTKLVKQGTGILIITHYSRFLKYLKPNRVSIIKSGTIVKEGGWDLVKQIEKEGYESI